MSIKKMSFIIALGFSLINLAYAETTTNASGEVVVDSSNTPESDTISESHTSTHKFDPEEVYSDQDMVNSVTMLGVGAVAKSLLKCEIKTTDTMIAGAGGVAYLAGEVYAFFGYKDIENKISQYTRDSENNLIDSDRKALETQKKNYEEVLGVMEVKQILQYAAAAGFTGAAAMAYWSAWELNKLSGECKAALGEAKGTCAEALAASEGVDQAARSCLNGLPKVAQKGGIIDALLDRGDKYSEAQHTEMIGETEQFKSTFSLYCFNHQCAAKAKSTCDKYLAEIKKNLNKCDQNSLNDPEFMEKVAAVQIDPITFFLAVAYAESKIMRLLGIGGVGFSVYKGIVGGQSNFIDRMIAKPLNRGIAFTALAGLAYMAANSSGEIIDQLKSNIAKIKGILKPMNSPDQANIYSSETVAANIDYDYVDLDTGEKVTISAASVAEDYEAASSSLSTDTLGDLDLGTAKTSGQMITKMSDNISKNSKLTGATLKSAKTLANTRGALNGNLRKIKDKLEASGSSRFNNLGSKEDNTKAELKSHTYRELQNAGLTQDQAKQIFNQIPAVEKKKKATASKSVKLATKKASEPDFSMYYKKIGDSKKKSVNKKVEAIDTAAELNRYQDNQADIHKGSGSLWNILSNRYFKSAYPEFSDE